MNIVITGAGAFGTAMAVALAGKGSVTLLGRDADTMQEIRKSRINAARLPGVHLPDSIDVTSDADCLQQAEIVLLCVPTQKLAGYLKSHASLLSNAALLACCKGIDLATLEGPTAVIAKHVPNSLAGVLTGPSFASDIAKGLPTALTLACGEEDGAQRLQRALTRPYLRLYRCSDVTGAELGGALKNVIAIAAGCCVGAGLGESARAALITRGFAEMQRLAFKLGAKPETLMGLSGLGDLILTCSSEQSRNFRFGLAIGQGQKFDTSTTVEGVATANAVAQIATRTGLDLPVTQAVNDLISGQISLESALQSLLSRPLKEE